MFRASKKRPLKGDNSQSRRQALSRDHSSSEDDEAVRGAGVGGRRAALKRNISTNKAGNRKKKLSVSASRGIPLSFQGHGDEVLSDDNNPMSKIKQRMNNRSGGMGFGGGTEYVEEDVDCDGDLGNENPASITGSLLYDRESLQKLVSEQKRLQRPEGSNDLSSIENHVATMELQRPISAENPDFIPLAVDQQQTTYFDEGQYHSPMSGVVILTGEEAFALQQNQPIGYADNANWELRKNFTEAARIHTNADLREAESEQADMNEQQDAANDDWETEVIRRAGVSANEMAPVVTYPHKFVRGSSKPVMSTMQLRDQIAKSLQDLEDRSMDLANAELRRKAEIEQNKVQVAEHENDMKHAGKALEFYQHWRERLIGWVGAAREIRDKVELILSSLHVLEGEKVAVHRWQDWENDVIAVLYEHQLLNRVVGRQPPDIIFHDVMTTVDEFGRDVKSQHGLQREQRRRKRERIQQKRKLRMYVASGSELPSTGISGAESDGLISDEEEESLRTRHTALAKALSVATDGLDEEFTMLHNLFALFEEWYKEYPDEYKQSYASLSLADIASILIQIELCALNDPWNESAGYNEAKWTTIINEALVSGIMDNAAVERLIDRSVLPAITDLLDKVGINLASSRQMKSLGKFVGHIEKIVTKDSIALKNIRSRMIDYMLWQLGNLAYPIISADKVVGGLVSDDDELKEALVASTVGQMCRSKKILLNLLLYWAPIMDNEFSFIEDVLRFVSERFLVILSTIRSMQHRQTVETSIFLSGLTGAEEAFLEVRNVLMETGWLDRPDLMMLTAPVRAASEVLSREHLVHKKGS